MAMYANGNQVSGCTSYASAVNYIEEDGSKSTVQDKISELSSKIGNIVYSEEETVVGTWVDGKPLYRKVFNNLSINTSTSGWKDVGSLPNVKNIIEVNYLIVDKDGRQRMTNPQVQLSYLNGKVYTAAISDITSGLNLTLKVVELLYTKTTD